MTCEIAGPNAPLAADWKISMVVQMRVTWVSGDKAPQQVQYGDGKMQTSEVTTFSQDDMISELLPFSSARLSYFYSILFVFLRS